MKERNKFTVAEFCGTTITLLLYGACWWFCGLLVGAGSSNLTENRQNNE